MLYLFVQQKYLFINICINIYVYVSLFIYFIVIYIYTYIYIYMSIYLFIHLFISSLINTYSNICRYTYAHVGNRQTRLIRRNVLRGHLSGPVVPLGPQGHLTEKSDLWVGDPVVGLGALPESTDFDLGLRS